MNNWISYYALLSSITEIFRFFSGPLGCAAFCVTVVEYGGNRGNALWDLVIGVSS